MEQQMQKGVDKIWTISLVYTKQLETKVTHALRSIVLYAKNEDEALGAGIRLIEAEFKDHHWALYLKTVVDTSGFVEELKKEIAPILKNCTTI